MSDRTNSADRLGRTRVEQRPAASERAPDRPSQLGRGHWLAAVKRMVSEYRADNLSDWAASLTYYGVLSIFPALLVLVSAIGLAGHSVTQSLLDNLGQLAPGSVRQVLGTAIGNLQNSQRSAGVLVVVSLLVALWSASGYVAAFMRASNVIYDVPEGRPIWKTVPIRIAVTVVMLVLLAASALAVIVTGGLADRVGRVLGIGSMAVTIWEIAKWPVLLVVVSFMFGLLYWASPNARQGFRWVTPGGVLAVVVWVVASAAFAVYVANFSSYNKTYGSLAGVIVFLVWLWISNLAILLGAELNAELERGRSIAAGQPHEREPYMELRDTSKLKEPDKL
jgi:YihY family inner membrane protein